MGRETRVTGRINGAPLAAYTTTYSYDYSGKVKSMTYPDGYQVNHAYFPESGLLHTINGITDFIEYAESSGYEPTGKIGDIYHGNGAETVYSYDGESTRLLSIQTTDPNLADLQHKTYMYTPAGDIKAITRSDGAASVTYTYAYDKLHRLIGETHTGASASFDPALLTKTFDDTAPIHAVKFLNVNGADYLYEYDENGNMTQSWDVADPSQPVERQIDYNADNMLVQIRHLRSSGTMIVDLSYDGEGVRVKKSIAGGSTTYYIGDHFEVAEGVEIKYIFAGNLRITKVTTAGQQFFHKDHLGSSTVMTNYVDGSVAESAEYLPIGLTRKQGATEVTYYKFSDQEIDAEVGLYNFNARLYDPAIGIFISPDSIVQDPYDPQTLNRYSYCRNNPILYVDPSGHIFGIDDILIGAAIGAILGGGVAAATDGDIGQGMLMGAIGGAFFGAAGGVIQGLEITSAVAQAGIHAGAGAASGGINAAIAGNDIGLGMLTGGLAAGIANYAGGFIPQFGNKVADFTAQLTGRSIIGGITGGITAEIYGGRFGQGFAYGAATGAYGFLFNHVLHDILRGIQKSIIEGVKAGKYSVARTANELVNNKQLHDGVKTGAIAALKVTVITAEIEAIPIAFGLSLMYPTTATMIISNPATPVVAVDFVFNGYLSPWPPSTPSQVAGWALKKVNDWAFDLP